MHHLKGGRWAYSPPLPNRLSNKSERESECGIASKAFRYCVESCKFVKSPTMSTVELRHSIIKMLSQIDDASFLKAIKTIVESKANEDVYKLSDFQQNRIEESREQVKLGQTISDDALQKEIKQWLGTR